MAVDAALISAQARIFEEIARHRSVCGLLDDLAWRFEVAPGDFLACLKALVDAGWVAVTADLEHLSIRLSE